MAVINEAGKVLAHPQDSSQVGGRRRMQLIKAITIAAADDDTSKFLIGEIPDSAVLEEITLESPAITAGTSYSVGLGDVDGNVINATKFAAALDMSTVTGLPVGPLGDPIRQGMIDLALTDASKEVWELAGHVNKPVPATGETLKKSKYRLLLTANTIGSANATIVVRVSYLMLI